MSQLETQEILYNWEQLLFDEHSDNLNLALVLSETIPAEDLSVLLLIKYLVLWTESQSAYDNALKLKDMQLIYEHLQSLDIEFSISTDFFLFGKGLEQYQIIRQWWQQSKLQVGEAIGIAILKKGMVYLPWLYDCFLASPNWHSLVDIENLKKALRKYNNLQEEDTKIYFKKNRELTQLPARIFDIPNLQYIICEDCPLQQLPLGLLYHCQALKGLYLINVSLKHLNLDLCNLPNLKKLSFSNGERKLSLELNGEKQLEVLDISNNQLKRLPMWLWEMKNLKAMYIDNMNMSHFPPAVLALEQLEKLSMRNTNFTDFPNKFKRFTALEYLDLSGGHWSQLPDFFEELKALKTLKLNACNFKSFPIVLSKMPKLQHLEMDDNFIRFVDIDILSVLFKKLKTLSIKRAFSTTSAEKEFFQYIDKCHTPFLKIIT